MHYVHVYVTCVWHDISSISFHLLTNDLYFQHKIALNVTFLRLYIKCCIPEWLRIGGIAGNLPATFFFNTDTSIQLNMYMYPQGRHFFLNTLIHLLHIHDDVYSQVELHQTHFTSYQIRYTLSPYKHMQKKKNLAGNWSWCFQLVDGSRFCFLLGGASTWGTRSDGSVSDRDNQRRINDATHNMTVTQHYWIHTETLAVLKRRHRRNWD